MHISLHHPDPQIEILTCRIQGLGEDGAQSVSLPQSLAYFSQVDGEGESEYLGRINFLLDYLARSHPATLAALALFYSNIDHWFRYYTETKRPIDQIHRRIGMEYYQLVSKGDLLVALFNHLEENFPDRPHIVDDGLILFKFLGELLYPWLGYLAYRLETLYPEELEDLPPKGTRGMGSLDGVVAQCLLPLMTLPNLQEVPVALRMATQSFAPLRKHKDPVVLMAYHLRDQLEMFYILVARTFYMTGTHGIVQLLASVADAREEIVSQNPDEYDAEPPDDFETH